MKGTLIGTDYLETGNDVKIIEINTNSIMFNKGVQYLDFTPLFNTLLSSSIDEFHYIYTTGGTTLPLEDNFNSFRDTIKTFCDENSISFTDHAVPKNSITVPDIEDGDNKFILRQAYDTSAIVDSTYTADKFEFFKLMSGSQYVPNTYFSSSDDNLFLDGLTSIDYSQSNHPNLVEKSRYPQYNLKQFPKLSVLDNLDELNDKKENLEDTLLQEFIYDEKSIVDGYWSVIRSFDIIYGSNLDIITLGGYKHSTIVPMDFCETSFVDGTKDLDGKSRFKYINKNLITSVMTYHTDEESDILLFDDTITSVENLNVGDDIKTIRFELLVGSEFDGETPDDFPHHVGSMELTSQSLEFVSSSLVSSASQEGDVLMIEISLDNGEKWLDTMRTNYYIEASGSSDTHFEFVNRLLVGDKIVTFNKNTKELNTREITNLNVVYKENQKIYNLDFEPNDYFLVDINNDEFTIMHNECFGCDYADCGTFPCDNSCPGCGSPGFPSGITPYGCLTSDTLIQLSDGSNKLISELKVGESLKSLKITEVPQDTELYENWSVNSLLDIESSSEEIISIKIIENQPIYKIKFEETELKSSDSHLHIVGRDGIWKIRKTTELKIGDIFVTSDNKEVEINEIEEFGTDDVYMLTVSGNHLYYANGILTHNAKKF